jgi:hypothetical protein
MSKYVVAKTFWLGEDFQIHTPKWTGDVMVNQESKDTALAVFEFHSIFDMGTPKDTLSYIQTAVLVKQALELGYVHEARSCCV